jgi:hypothetical protein
MKGCAEEWHPQRGYGPKPIYEAVLEVKDFFR